MAGKRAHFVMSEELIARIDAAAEREGISRGEWTRRAVEVELKRMRWGATPEGAVERAFGGNYVKRPASPEPHPDEVEAAEQPEVPGGRRPSDYGMDEAARAEFVRPIREQLPSARPFQGSYDPFKKR